MNPKEFSKYGIDGENLKWVLTKVALDERIRLGVSWILGMSSFN